jgi:hypothetical protein
MFYSDYGFRSYSARISNYIIRFVSHYDEYVNSRLVRSVDLNDVVWC